MIKKKQIGMSSCLAGQFVRYDGENEYRAELYQTLQQRYQILSFCPEVAIGLTIPRPAIHLRQINQQIRVLDKQTGQKDYTEQLYRYAKLVAQRYPNLHAYIFKQSSPSCGLGKTKLHTANGQFTQQFTDGIFAQQLSSLLPNMLIYTEDSSEILTLLNKNRTF